ncbi:MAG: PKD domain-containing protein [Chloroflexi bacterium]|nr:PKD domain-containing protein [Chloroflexota bacterium]
MIPPTALIPPTSQFPLNIAILSPAPGNIVAGNVQVLGSASHPQFLQYQLEWGPDPNPGNLWYPVNAPLFNPVVNGLLGVWNTIGVQDARYQLRLRVYLRDGRVEQTVVSNITVQNRINTPVPSATPIIPRPIAAFTQDVTTGNFPLTVRFFNQSTGSISSLAWNFGDGSTSAEANPVHTFGSPGLYTVQLTVAGPGGTSNVSRQISVTSPSAPVAGFTQDRLGGVAPLTVQFTDQSTGTINSYFWNFSDGQSSIERNPLHVFTTPGTYNVILTVTGPGGSSSVVRQISVSSLIPPTATFPPPTRHSPTHQFRRRSPLRQPSPTRPCRHRRPPSRRPCL